RVKCILINLHYVLLFYFTIELQNKFTLFPYTTLFRSKQSAYDFSNNPSPDPKRTRCDTPKPRQTHRRRDQDSDGFDRRDHKDVRSEEHTSELQSREKLVCRLLLEKKNEKNTLFHMKSY